MTLPASSRFALVPDLSICRILNGMWQVSGAHGPIDPRRAVDAMFAYHDAGFTTWDLADHYGPGGGTHLVKAWISPSRASPRSAAKGRRKAPMKSSAGP